MITIGTLSTNCRLTHLLCPHQMAGLRVTKVRGQLPHQCHQGLIDLEVPAIHTMAGDAAGSLGAI